MVAESHYDKMRQSMRLQLACEPASWSSARKATAKSISILMIFCPSFLGHLPHLDRDRFPSGERHCVPARCCRPKYNTKYRPSTALDALASGQRSTRVQRRSFSQTRPDRVALIVHASLHDAGPDVSRRAGGKFLDTKLAHQIDREIQSFVNNARRFTQKSTSPCLLE